MNQTVGRDGLDRAAAVFFGADADAVLHGDDEDLPVADFPAAVLGALEDGFDAGVDELVVDSDLDADLGDQVW